MKLAAAFLLTLAYVALLLAIYVLHAWYFPVGVVLYSALADAALAAAILLAPLTVWRSLPLGGFERFLLVLVWLLGGYAFAISVPTVIDRSLSFYILEKLQQRGGGIEAARIGEIFVEEYMPEYRLVDVRLTEQLESGTVVIENGCVKLTPRGRAVAKASSFIRAWFMPRKRLLAGEYTDALVEPFATSPGGPQGYECR